MITISAILASGVVLLQSFVLNADAASNTDRLNPGERLVAGERLVSPDGQYVLAMQGDGNLVEYAPGNRPVWATATRRPNSEARLQSDGNLVVIAPGNVPVWSSRTDGNAGSTLELQNDGNIVLYAPGHLARWSTGGSGGALGDRIAAIARAEAGNSQRNRETGTNCNFYSGQMGEGSPCGNGRRAEPWCADFARWVWGQAGARTNGLSSGAVSFKTAGAWTDGSALSGVRPGDAIGYRFHTGTTSNDHVGIVVAINGNGTVSTIEGNLTDGVRPNTVTRGNTDISGYARPQAR
ncbi:CHAP domain-containing protein [Actinoplanes sp. NPDC051633]|uniref:CHAP domain-containing protein n=1 Tax=Actinoplanes sp. NPDC051633 TaxID=3155670 RepID=UPI0034147592